MEFPIQPGANAADEEEQTLLSTANHLRWIDARHELERQRALVVRKKSPPTFRRTTTSLERKGCTSGASSSTSTSDSTGPRTNETMQRLPVIPSSSIPPNNEHHAQQEHHVMIPTSNDVLFGRGRPFQEHAGNVRLSLILESLKVRYEGLKRNEKTSLAQDIVQNMKSKGIRFLRQSNNKDNGYHWEQVDDVLAREKVSQGFRSMRPSSLSTSSVKNNKGGGKRMDDDGLGVLGRVEEDGHSAGTGTKKKKAGAIDLTRSPDNKETNNTKRPRQT